MVYFLVKTKYSLVAFNQPIWISSTVSQIIFHISYEIGKYQQNELVNTNLFVNCSVKCCEHIFNKSRLSNAKQVIVCIYTIKMKLMTNYFIGLSLDDSNLTHSKRAQWSLIWSINITWPPKIDASKTLQKRTFTFGPHHSTLILF